MEQNIKLKNNNLNLKRIHNPEGYFANNNYHYYRRDHLGNNREVWNATANTTVQKTQYYPSGLPWATNSGDNAGVQPYKYNGKEFIEMHGLDEYYSNFRNYYATIGRTTTQDAHAESYYAFSPYAWVGNRFTRAIDPDGRDWYSAEKKEENKKYDKIRITYKWVEGQMSKEEMEKGGYTHLGKTHTEGDRYFSLFGSEKNLTSTEGKIYQKIDEAIERYARGRTDEMNHKQSLFDSESHNFNYKTDFTIQGIGKANINYEGSYFGVYMNFTGQGMNKANMENWIGDSNMPMIIDGYLGSGEAKKSYHIRFQNSRRGDPLHLKFNEKEAKILLRKYHNLYPQLNSKQR
jgi:RHS repeat-associated protein